MSKTYCNSCQRYRIKYCSYPEVICKDCCSKIPVRTILQIMNISYHEAISSEQQIDLKENNNELDATGPIFWCTMNKEGLYQRCGVGYDINYILKNKYYEEDKMVIIEAYRRGEQGLKDMKQLKQNFRRIRLAQPYLRY